MAGSRGNGEGSIYDDRPTAGGWGSCPSVTDQTVDHSEKLSAPRLVARSPRKMQSATWPGLTWYTSDASKLATVH